MGPEERRQWVRSVLGSAELTAAHKVVLLALETYADYRDGTNARPGEANLAATCHLKVRAVRYALEAGQALGFIEQTRPSKPGAGLAAVYRLTRFTGTVVPVDNSFTGTAVPVNESPYRHGHAKFTGMAMPPTLQAPENYLPKSGTAPSAAACPDCQGTHWLVDGEGNPVGRCKHPLLATAVGHA